MNTKWFFTDNGHTFVQSYDVLKGEHRYVCSTCGTESKGKTEAARRARYVRWDRLHTAKQRVCIDRQGFVFGLPWTEINFWSRRARS